MALTDEEWVERPVKRLERLENAVRDIASNQREITIEQVHLREAVEAIQQTLSGDQATELANLRARAELPRRILMAVLVPVLIAVITAILVTALHGGIHVGG